MAIIRTPWVQVAQLGLQCQDLPVTQSFPSLQSYF